MRHLTADDLVSNRALDGDGVDAFGYAPVAGRVADTLTSLEPPLTVGLFGPWGSGKSSMFELIARDLRERRSTARFVRYDASTYGGEALKRNFISHIASELGFDPTTHPDFHTGLYESKRTSSFDLGEIKKTVRPALTWLAGAYVAFLGVFAALIGLTSVATDEDFLGEVGRALPDLIAPTAIAGLVIAITQLIFRGASVDSEQSQPATDEEFARRFRTLVGTAIAGGTTDRLIVFVDELDRCSPKDVVATLTAIRTFLDEPHCAFVVAADRAALERALEKELPQPTPIDEDNPYYSSAGSFFDKVFHDRVPLPPLRGQRLYEYAYQQVEEREGFWGDLRGRDEGRAIRRVLYVLIASHVRAPRRVKILLNGFVRSAAIAENRGIEWLARSPEIAKLTVLETEFPELADDLRSEPRLVEFLLRPPAKPSRRVAQLLERHGGNYISRSLAQRQEALDGDEGNDDSSSTAPGGTVLADVSLKQRRAMSLTEREYLRRYLVRTRDVRIGRDLLFLEPAGAAIGIDDPQIGDLLDQSVDDPEAVVEGLAESDVETRQLAARVLASMADQEFAEEATNVVTALLRVVEDLGSDADPVAHEVVGSLRSFERDEGLADEHLTGALTLALTVDDIYLRDKILSDPRLVDDPDRLVRVTRMVERIPSKRRKVVHDAVGQATGVGNAEPLLQGLRHLPEEDAKELFESPSVSGAVDGILAAEDNGSGHELIERVYGCVLEPGRGRELLEAVQRFVLERGVAYDLVRQNAERALGDVATSGSSQRNEDVLAGLSVAPTEDWRFWIGYLTGGDHSEAEDLRACELVRNRLSGVHSQDERAQGGVAFLVGHLAGYVASSTDEDRTRTLAALETELQATTWWAGDEALAVQERIHAIGRELASGSPSLEASVDGLLSADLIRAPIDLPSLTAIVLAGMGSMGSKLGMGASSVLTHLQALNASEVGQIATDLIGARVALASAEQSGEGSFGASVVNRDDLHRLSRSNDKKARRTLVEWLLLEPEPASVVTVVKAVGDAPSPALARAVGKWASRQPVDVRTDFMLRTLRLESDVSRWISEASGSDFDEPLLVKYIVAEVQNAARGDRREALVAALVALKPSDPSSQHEVGDLMVHLLATGKLIDHRIAVAAIPALGTGHKSATRIRDAFKQAADEHGHQLSKRAVKALADAKVKVARKSVAASARDVLKDLFG